MINMFRILFDTFFACCGSCVGVKFNRIVMWCMSFAGAFIGDLLWQVVMEIIA